MKKAARRPTVTYGLLPVEGMPVIPGAVVPEDIYPVLAAPACLAGMRKPGDWTPWQALYDQGYHYVVNLRESNPSYEPAPLRVLYSARLEDLEHGEDPTDPESELLLIGGAVQATQDALERSQGVVIHCWAGRGRTGTVLGCVLRALGFESDVVLNYLSVVQQARGATGWPEARWQADVVRRWK